MWVERSDDCYISARISGYFPGPLFKGDINLD